MWGPTLVTYHGFMNHSLVLVVTEDTSLQNGLLALLTTIPGVGAVLVAEDCSSGMRLMKIHNPHLVFLDMTLCEKLVVDLLKEIKYQLPNTATVAISDNDRQNETAISLEADGILHKGFSAESLVSITEAILAKREPESRPHSENSDFGTGKE
jgi:DNA-binding NarL/FixJ family response regulator